MHYYIKSHLPRVTHGFLVCPLVKSWYLWATTCWLRLVHCSLSVGNGYFGPLGSLLFVGNGDVRQVFDGKSRDGDGAVNTRISCPSNLGKSEQSKETCV